PLLSAYQHGNACTPSSVNSLSLSTIRPPPYSTLFPYTTLFRSLWLADRPVAARLEGNFKLSAGQHHAVQWSRGAGGFFSQRPVADRKSTRLNSSHQIISYAVFCLKKKKKRQVDQSDRLFSCIGS